VGEDDVAPAETGSITVFVLLVVVALVVTIGVVAEGGAVLSARESASAEAEQAAREGAASVLPATLRSGGTATGGAPAESAAEWVMAADGHPGTATWSAGQLTATVTPFRIDTPILALVGLPTITVSASASARAVAG
jgi:hypothetical protein